MHKNINSHEKEISGVFDYFGKDGFIDISELKIAVAALGTLMTETNLTAMMTLVDLKDEKISRDYFISWWLTGMTK